MVPGQQRTGYVHGYKSASDEMATRTAENFAAFFLPRLSPGMSLLDIGCGPGTITADLAQRVAPGKVVGIDIGPSEVAKATTLAREMGLKNASFEVGDATALRFTDGDFDAVFSSNALEHVPDAVAAMREIARVVKPGSIVGLKGGSVSCSRAWPETSVMSRLIEVYTAVWKDMGGHPEMGIEQLGLLEDAGLSRVEVTGTFHTRQARTLHFSDRLIQPSFMRRAEALGIPSSELKRLATEFAAWEQNPDALILQAVIQVVAKKPA